MKISNNPLIIPETVSSERVLTELSSRHDLNAYLCPNCKVEKIPSCSNGIGWVICPIFDHKYLCEACCIDISSVAHDLEYQVNPFISLLDEAAARSGRTVAETHLICLNHQLQILDELLHTELPGDWRTIRERQRQEVLTLMRELERESDNALK